MDESIEQSSCTQYQCLISSGPKAPPYSRVCNDTSFFVGVPGGSVGKESTCNAGDVGRIPGLGRSPGEGHGNPVLPGFLPGWRAWWATIHRVAKNRIWLKWLSIQACPFFAYKSLWNITWVLSLVQRSRCVKGLPPVSTDSKVVSGRPLAPMILSERHVCEWSSHLCKLHPQPGRDFCYTYP